MKLADWLRMLGCHLVVNGAVYSPTNTFLNVSIKQNDSPYCLMQLTDHFGSSLFGRSEGDQDNFPVLADAISNLMDQIVGKRVMFEANGPTFPVPELFESPTETV